jgi:hypothetical protein
VSWIYQGRSEESVSVEVALLCQEQSEFQSRLTECDPRRAYVSLGRKQLAESGHWRG